MREQVASRDAHRRRVLRHGRLDPEGQRLVQVDHACVGKLQHRKSHHGLAEGRGVEHRARIDSRTRFDVGQPGSGDVHPAYAYHRQRSPRHPTCIDEGDEASMKLGQVGQKKKWA
ncbi:MAG: hypothetical protein ABIU58_01530 [Ramlibacter sp.]